MVVDHIVRSVLSDLQPYLRDGQPLEFDIALGPDGPDSRVSFTLWFDADAWDASTEEELEDYEGVTDLGQPLK